MGTERKTIEEEMRLICHHCGNQLEIRKFETDEGMEYGIFDNCIQPTEQMIYPTLKEAIEAFNG